MRPTPDIPFNAEFCRATVQLRDRLRRQVGEIAALRAELCAVRADIDAERAELVAWLESPEAERDALLLAQKLVRDEMLRAACARETCASCGGLGRGAAKGLFATRLARMGEELGEVVEGEPLREEDWPTAPGTRVLKGRRLSPTWLREREGRAPRSYSGPDVGGHAVTRDWY